MRTIAFIYHWVVCSIAMLLLACSGPRLMMPTPNLYTMETQDPYRQLNPDLKNTEVQLLYITDRMPKMIDSGELKYGYERSASVAFGTAVVDLGINMTWEELLQASQTQQRPKSVKIALRQVTEHKRAPRSPLPYTLVGSEIVAEPTLMEKRHQAAQAFRRMLVEKLAFTSRKEVFIYIHGYHNDFDDAAFAMAELWHFLGRIGVPIIYTWPAGYPGMFGYTYDRESSEFTVYHLREVLGFIASFPEVEKIHIIAHSRGTDVAVSALRELTIQARAAGTDPRSTLKIYNFILAAPDLDFMVAEQRIDGDSLPLSVHRFTIYTSPDDRAIGLARKLFRSPKGRIGNIGSEELPQSQLEMAEFYGTSDYAVIQFTGKSGSLDDNLDRYGHSYFRNAPTVSSDLVLILRDDLDPGSPGRPLEPLPGNFWRIPPGYPGVVLND